MREYEKLVMLIFYRIDILALLLIALLLAGSYGWEVVFVTNSGKKHKIPVK